MLSLSEVSKASPPSFDDDVPSTPPKIVPAVQYPPKQLIETKSEVKKTKPSSSAFCSCFGTKSSVAKEKPTHPLTAPHASLPEIEMPIPSSNISSTLKNKGPLRAPSSDLPPVDFTSTATENVRLPAIHIHEKKQKSPNETEAVVPNVEKVKNKKRKRN